MTSNKFKAALITSVLAFCGASQAITIEFDYSYDSNNFFDASKRSVMDQVASLYGRNLTDSLAAITSTTFNHATFRPFDPNDIINTLNLPNQSVAADTVRIYLGATALGSTTLGVGGPGGWSASGAGFSNVLATRGESNTSGSFATDFAPWGGSISFSNTASWYVDSNVATTESFSGKFDLYSVAMHEVGHVLGVGTADSWLADISGTSFVGSNSLSAKGGPISVTSDDGHWVSGTNSVAYGLVQEAAMSPSISAGQRKYFTELDWAGMRDIGWEVASLSPSLVAVTAVPEPEQYALLMAGLTLIGWVARRRKVTRS